MLTDLPFPLKLLARLPQNTIKLLLSALNLRILRQGLDISIKLNKLKVMILYLVWVDLKRSLNLKLPKNTYRVVNICGIVVILWDRLLPLPMHLKSFHRNGLNITNACSPPATKLRTRKLIYHLKMMPSITH